VSADSRRSVEVTTHPRVEVEVDAQPGRVLVETVTN
jgi:hypothetical protein